MRVSEQDLTCITLGVCDPDLMWITLSVCDRDHVWLFFSVCVRDLSAAFEEFVIEPSDIPLRAFVLGIESILVFVIGIMC